MSSDEKCHLRIRVQRIVVGDESGCMEGPFVVELNGGKIAKVEKNDEMSNADICFGHDSTLMPGFIDLHVHLSIFSAEYQTDVFRLSPEERALRSLVNAQGLLRAGIGRKFYRL